MTNRTFLNYTVQHLLGEGGMATVYYAENPIGKKAAIKVLKPELALNPDIRSRFKQEARLMVGLDHPNIRQVYDLFEEGDTLAIVMEYLEGEDLGEWVGAHGRVPVPKAIDWMKQTMSAIQHAHEKGVVHRDLKPSNLFLTRKGEIKVLDFGIARIGEGNLNLTRTDTRMGSPMYMSPEQIRNPRGVNTLTDIYSLGVTFYALITGKRPYDTATDSEFDLQTLIVKEPLPAIPGLPRQLQQVIDTATAKLPEHRFPSAEAFGRALSVPIASLDDKTEIDPVSKIHTPADGQTPVTSSEEELEEDEGSGVTDEDEEPDNSGEITLKTVRRSHIREILGGVGVIAFFLVMGYVKGWFSFGEKELQVVQVMGKYGYMDASGEMVINAEYDEAKPFEGDHALVKKGLWWFYIDRKGNSGRNSGISIPLKADTTVSYRSRALAALEAQDPPEAVKQPAKDPASTTIYESLTLQEKPAPEKPAGVSRLESLLLTAKRTDFSYMSAFGPTGMAEVKDKNTGLFGVVNQQMRMVVSCQYMGLMLCNNGYLVAWKEPNKLGFLNKSGAPVTGFTYNRAGCFVEGRAPVKKGLFWGYVDIQGKEVIPPSYLEVGEFQNGKALVKDFAGDAFYLNLNGTCIQDCP